MKFTRRASFPHYKNGRFFNPHELDSKRKLWNIFLWMCGYYNNPSELQPAISDHFSYPPPQEMQGKNCVQWINHSTFLIRAEGLNILTDPVWTSHAAPIPFLGPKRNIAPGISLNALPPLDYVLISHNHYDHLDIKTIKKISRDHPQAVFFVPLKLKEWFWKRGIQKIVELDWWEAVKVPRLTITSVPAQHCSGRKLTDKDSTLWCGWVTEFEDKNSHAVKRLYFAGDTGYNSIDFTEIGKEFGQIDVSLIPIGSYVPRKFMSPVHISPKEAVCIHEEVLSRLSIAGHFGTFRLSSEPLERPAFDLYRELEKKSISPDRFCIPIPGQPIYW